MRAFLRPAAVAAALIMGLAMAIPASAFPAAAAKPEISPAACVKKQERYVEGAWLRLWGCPSPRPGVLWYHASFDKAVDWESVMVAYNPYYSKGFVPGSEIVNTGGPRVVDTPNYYGDPPHLQACAKAWFSENGNPANLTLFCAWDYL